MAASICLIRSTAAFCALIQEIRADQSNRSNCQTKCNRPSLVVRRGTVYVWDGGPQALQPTGREEELTRGLTRVRSTEPPDDFTLSAFAQMGSQALGSPAELLGQQTRAITPKRGPTRQHIASRGRGSVVADVVTSEKLNGAQVEVRERASNALVARLRLQVRDRIGVVEFLEIDNNGRMFVLTENIPNNSKRPSAAFVVRYSSQGVQESVYDIPLQDSVALSRRFVAISPDGDVYFLRSRKAETDVIGVGSRNVRANAVIENPNLPRLVEPDKKIAEAPIAAVHSLARQQVIQTAFAFESVQWRLAPANYGRDPDTACSGFSRIRRPGYLAGKLNQEVRSVPYCWGCHGSLQPIPGQHRERHARRECLHAQRSAPGCYRSGLFGVRQRRLGGFPPIFTTSTDPRHYDPAAECLGSAAW